MPVDYKEGRALKSCHTEFYHIANMVFLCPYRCCGSCRRMMPVFLYHAGRAAAGLPFINACAAVFSTGVGSLRPTLSGRQAACLAGRRDGWQGLCIYPSGQNTTRPAGHRQCVPVARLPVLPVCLRARHSPYPARRASILGMSVLSSLCVMASVPRPMAKRGT